MIRFDIPVSDLKKFIVDRDIEPLSAAIEYMDAYLDTNDLVDQLNERGLYRCIVCGYWFEQKDPLDLTCNECENS
jgi:rubrerythrin